MPLFLVISSNNAGLGQANSFSFLDARSKSLGGLSSSLTHSAYVFLWNPANLTFTRQPNFSLNVNETFFYSKAAIADFVPKIGSVGFILGRLPGEVETDYAGVGLAKKYPSGFNLGFSTIIFERQESYSTQFGIGLSYFPFKRINERIINSIPIYWDRLGFAVVIQNMVLTKQRLDIPLKTTIGASYVWVPSLLQTFTEIQRKDGDTDFILGLEFSGLKSTVLRTGIADFDSKRWLYGGGIILGNLQLDLVYERFERKIQFSANVRFGATPSFRAQRNYEKGLVLLDKKQYEQALSQFHDAVAFQPENKRYQRTYKMVNEQQRQRLNKERQMLNIALVNERKGYKLSALFNYHDLLIQFPGNEIAQRKVILLRPSVTKEMSTVKIKLAGLLQTREYVKSYSVINKIHHIFPKDSLILTYKKMVEDTLKKLADDGFIRGLGYYSQKNLKAAYREFNQVKEFNPSYPSIDEYLSDVKTRIQTIQTQIDSLLSVANELEKSNNFIGAVNLYTEILELDRENRQARQAINLLKPQFNLHISNIYSRAEAAFRNKNYLLAESLCSNILKIQNDYQLAKDLRLRSRTGRLNLAQKFVTLGDSAYVVEDDSSALVYYRSARELNPGNNSYSRLVNRSQIRIEKEQKWQQAQKAFLENNYLLAEELTIGLMSAEPENQEYAAYVSRIRSAKNRKITQLLQRGIQQYSQKQYQAAADTFDELIKLDPDHQTAKEYRRRTVDIITALQNIK